MSLSVFIGFIIAMIATIGLTPIAQCIAFKWNIVDKPGKRRIHKIPIPRFGGIAIYLGLLAGLAFTFWNSSFDFQNLIMFKVLIVGGLLALFIGLFDDIVGIGAKKKLALQLVLGGIVYAMGFRMETLFLGIGQVWNLGYLSLPFTMLWIAAVMNAVNLIDGVDGLAAGISATIFLVMGLFAMFLEPLTVMGVFSWVAAGACIGFLVFNFSPARIFMGDAGSLLLGFLLAVLTVSIPARGSGAVLPIYVPLLLLAYPMMDMVVAILRRAVKASDRAKDIQGISRKAHLLKVLRHVLSADGDHIHHRLLERGFSQKKLAILLYVSTACFSLLAFSLMWLRVPLNWVIVSVVLFLLSQFVLMLDYEEFLPKELRKQRQLESEISFGDLPATIRRGAQY